MKKILGLAITSLMLSGLLIGCGNSSNSSGDNNNNSDTGSDKSLVLGVVSISTQDWLNGAVIKGIQDVANEKGWKVDVVNANGSASDANAAIENFVSKKVDGIYDLVFPVTSLKKGLTAAKDAGIPVLTWGGGLDDGVAATNGAGGPFAVPVVKKMVEEMNGKGSILALTYHTGLVARQREKEFDKILKDYPDIKVTKEEVSIPGELQSGKKYAVSWLASHPKSSGNLAIWGSWDNPALGAAAEVKRQKRTDVKVYGENGQPSVMEAIKEGYFTGVQWENGVAEGKQLANLLPDIIAAGDEWEPKTYEVPGVYVDKSNVEEFMSSHPKGYEQ